MVYPALAMSIIQWVTGPVDTCGWDIETVRNSTTDSSLYFIKRGGGTQVAMWATHVTDTRPHSYGVRWPGSGNIDLYFDGKYDSSAALNDFLSCAGGVSLSVMKENSGATGQMQSGIGSIQIWERAIDKSQAESFFKAWHNLQFYGGN